MPEPTHEHDLQDDPARTSESQDFAVIRAAAPAGGFWIESARCEELSVPLERVWALISDDSRRAEWDPSTRPAPTPRAQDQDAAAGPSARPWHVMRSVERRRVSWSSPGTSRSQSDSPQGGRQVLQVSLESVDGGVRLVLRHAAPARGFAVRLSRPVLGRIMGLRLRSMARAIERSA